MNAILEMLKNPSVQMSHEEIKEAFALLRFRSDQFSRLAARNFKLDQIVEFDARDQHWVGKVKKVNQKTISVLTSSPQVMNWNVSPNLCRAV